VTDDEAAPGARRRVRRGEGEVTEWPRGLVDYTPTGPPEETPSLEEDRELNRLRIASRLLGFAQAQGRSVDGPIGRLREADRAFRAGDRVTARRLVDEVIGEAERLLDVGAGTDKPPS